MALPSFVRLVEVSPRDGLTPEKTMVSTADKIELIDRLSQTGLRSIEATSFVSPKWIPQLADAAEVFAGIARAPGIAYPVLVPNERGLERALASNVRQIAVFTAASDAFNLKNINCDIDESLRRIAPVVERARAAGLWVRGYVSTVLGCPYQGAVPMADVTNRTLHEQLALDDRQDDRALVLEVAIDQAGGHPRLVGDAGDAGGVEAVFDEALLRGGQDPLALCLGAGLGFG